MRHPEDALHAGRHRHHNQHDLLEALSIASNSSFISHIFRVRMLVACSVAYQWYGRLPEPQIDSTGKAVPTIGAPTLFSC